MKNEKRTALFIGQVWPEPKTTAAGQNILSYVDALKTRDWDVHFWSAAEITEHSFDLTSVDIKTRPIQINDDDFNHQLLALSPDVVVFDRFISEEQFGWRVIDTCPDALRVLNLEDLHGLREARLLHFKRSNRYLIANVGDVFRSENYDLLYNQKMLRELASIYRSDLSITLSDAELQWLQNDIDINPQNLFLLPFIRDNSAKVGLPFKQREHAVFIGNMLHKPNQYAVEYSVRHLWPALRASMPTCELYIYGEYANAHLTQLHKPKNGIHMCGYIEDHLKALESAKLLLAPIQVGAGVKGKLLDAMSHGTPSITTPIGAEGIPYKQWPGMICTNAEEMIKGCLNLMQNSSSWNSASKQCQLALLASGVSIKNADKFVSRIENSISQMTKLRLQNPVQQVMLQQSVQASRYLSKWIMLKNEKKA